MSLLFFPSQSSYQHPLREYLSTFYSVTVSFRLTLHIKTTSVIFMNAAFLLDRINATKAAIVAYEEVLLKLAANPAKSYTINTGQTTETVNRQSVGEIQATIKALIAQLDMYEGLYSGNSTIICRPSF